MLEREPENNSFDQESFTPNESFYQLKSELSTQLKEVFEQGLRLYHKQEFPTEDLFQAVILLNKLELTLPESKAICSVISGLFDLKQEAHSFIKDYIELRSYNIPTTILKFIHNDFKTASFVDVDESTELLSNILIIVRDQSKRFVLGELDSRVDISNVKGGAHIAATAVQSELLIDDDEIYEIILDSQYETLSDTAFIPDFVSIPVKTAKERSSPHVISNMIEMFASIDSQWMPLIRQVSEKCLPQVESIVDYYLEISKFVAKNPSTDTIILLTQLAGFYREMKWDITGLIKTFSLLQHKTLDAEFVSALSTFLNALKADPANATDYLPNRYAVGAILPDDIEVCFFMPETIKRIYAEGTVDYQQLIRAKTDAMNIELGLRLVTTREGFYFHPGLGVVNGAESATNDRDTIRKLRKSVFENRESIIFLNIAAKVSLYSPTAQNQGRNINRQASAGACMRFFIDELQNRTFSLQPFLNLNHALDNNQFKDAREAHEALFKIQVHTLYSIIVRSSDESVRDRASNMLSALSISDDTPFKQLDKAKNNPRTWDKLGENSREANRQTLSVVRRALTMHHGAFSALAIESRRTPDGEFPQLVRFAQEVGQADTIPVEFIDAKKIDKFPGRGFVIKNLDPHKIFVADKNNPSNPFHQYKNAWTDRANGVFIGDALDDFAYARFIFTRGFIAITGPQTSRYMIKDQEDKLTHYSLIIYNDHFENKSCNVAYLVPTAILNKNLNGITINYNDFRGYGFAQKDASATDLDFEGVIRSSNELKSNIIHITSGSNFGGTLSNAFPPGSAPYFSWETEKPRSALGGHDKFGHSHKSYYREDLSIFREAHFKVYIASNAYFDLFDLFNLSLEIYHKGETAGGILPIGDVDDFDLAGLDNEQLNPEEGSGFNPNSIRMLKEAYRWNQSDDGHVLVPVNILDNWGSIQNPPFILDTKNMTLRFADGTSYRFPESELTIGPEEINVWRSALRHVVGSDKFHLGLRFMNREMIPADLLASN